MKKLNIGIFLVSMAALALEISLIRFFSINLWYHFAFMVVSIALFGMGAAGTFLSLKPLKEPYFISSILFGITATTGVLIANKVVFDPYLAMSSPIHLLTIFWYYLLLGLPFFFFGIILSHAFQQHQAQSGMIYFYNMAGSALGIVAALFLLSLAQTKTILVISMIGYLSSLSFSSTRTQKLVAVGLLVLALLLLPVPLEHNISKYKELSQALNVPGSEHLERQYNAIGMVDLVESSFTRYAPGLSPTFKGELPEQIGVTIDGGSMNAITRFEDLSFLEHLPMAIGYRLGEDRNVLVINAGAGLDVLGALSHNATVTAAVSNPTVIDIVREGYATFSGDIYKKAKVEWSEGRNILHEDEYDVIFLSLAGSVLGQGGDISGLQENYLLTTEAFHAYEQALRKDGHLIITRWLRFPPRESLRLFSLALTIDPEATRTALFRSWTTVTLIVGKNPLDTLRIKAFTDENRFDLIYLRGGFIPNTYLRFDEPFYYQAVQNLLEDKETFFDEYAFDVRPVTDDRPFYFNFFKLSKLPELKRMSGQKWNPFLDAGFLLLLILVQALFVSLILIVLPLKARRKAVKRPLVYFFAIGLSYLFIEIVLIQRFVLYLDHIIISSSTVIFGMLLFSGLGARYSQENTIPLRRIIWAIVVLAVLLSILPLSWLSLLPLSVRIVTVIIIIAPLSFLMGFPFPTGMRVVKKELVPWAWAVNACASVLSPILAILIALFLGYRFVLILAAAIYLIGYVFINPSLSRSLARTSRR